MRGLGRPDATAKKWRDWKVVKSSYQGACHEVLVRLVTNRGPTERNRNDNESEMETALAALGGERVSVSTSRAGTLDVRPGSIGTKGRFGT